VTSGSVDGSRPHGRRPFPCRAAVSVTLRPVWNQCSERDSPSNRTALSARFGYATANGHGRAICTENPFSRKWLQRWGQVASMPAPGSLTTPLNASHPNCCGRDLRTPSKALRHRNRLPRRCASPWSGCRPATTERRGLVSGRHHRHPRPDLPPSAVPVFKLGIPPRIDQPCAVAEA
jgi:hypothetical protein